MEGINKNNKLPVSAGLTIFLLIIVVLLTSLVGLLILASFAYFKGIPFSELGNQLSINSSSNERYMTRFLVIQNHLFTFIFPTLIASWLIFRSDWKRMLGFRTIKRVFNPFLGAAFLVLAIPMTAVLYLVNQKIPLPAFVLDMESSTNQMIQSILIADTGFEMAFNVFLIGMLPAFGEEILFRGFLQRQFSRFAQSHHYGILFSAFLFSAIHMQFQGFLPRFFLGGLLGYLLYWTGNIWIPIIAHFAHNAFQVIAVYISEENIQEMDLAAIEIAPLPQLVIFTSLALLIGYYIYQVNKGNRLSLLRP